ncbi:TPA: hypothetical protein ACH3X2_009094 [Trebouxia sp. C0005]
MHAVQQQTHTHLSIKKQWQCFTTRHTKHNRVPADQQRTHWQKHRAQAPSTSTYVTSGGSEPPQDTSVQHEVPEGIAEPMSEEAVASEKQRQKKLWFAAVKPPMYTVSIIPILVSATAAYAASGTISLSKCLQLNLSSILIIAWLNLSNDAFDADMNIDGNKPESVVNLTGNRNGVLATAWACFAVGVAWLWSLVTGPAVQGDPRIACLLAMAISLGYLYQGPPFRLSYKGLGEPLCFVAFGPLATCAFYLAQVARPGGAVAPDVSPAAVVSSMVVGITTTIILFCSHFHQIADDKAANKMSPLVRLGTANAVKVLQLALLAMYVLVGVSASTGWLPAGCFGALCLAFPVVKDFLAFAEGNHTNPPVIRFLKLHGIKVHTAVGLALMAGLALPQVLATSL